MGDDSESIRILHVDDEPDLAEMAATFLEREDDRFTVETASNAEEGKNVLDEFDPDCIVSDYEMPGQNGIEFLETIRESHPDLPFILYTGKGSEEVASEAISAGVTDYLQKETGTEQYQLLANRIDNAVEHSRSVQALSRRNETLQRYRHMVDSLGESACIYDGNGRFEFANRYTADWYDTTPEELEGTKSPVISAVREAADGDPIEELLEGVRSEYRGQIEADFPDHGRAVVEYEFAPLNADGEIEGIVGTLRDRTARKDRKRTLKRFEAAAENAGHAVYFTDREGTIEYVNPAFERITGYDAGEVIGENPQILKSGEMDDEYYDELWETLLDGELWEEEVVNQRHDGEHYTAHQTIAPITEDGDEITGFVAIQADITDQRERERQLERSVETYEQLFHGVGDAVFVVEPGGRFLAVNDTACERLGYKRATLLEMRPADIDVEHSEQRVSAVHEQIEQVGSSTFETVHVSKSGERIPVELRASTIEYFGTNAILTIARDVSDRVEHRQELD